MFSQVQNTSTPQTQQQPPKPEQNRKNPFEEIPPAPAAPQTVGANVIESVEFHGARRIPQDALRNVILSKVGEVFSEDMVRLDIVSLRNTNRLDEIRVSTEKGNKGGVILRFVVTERPPTQ